MKRIKISPQTFTVKTVKNLQDDDGLKLDGRIRYTVSQILIDKDIDDFSKFLTLWHEIAHAILCQAGIKAENEETLVDVLAYGLMRVLQDNPHLREMKWS